MRAAVASSICAPYCCRIFCTSCAHCWGVKPSCVTIGLKVWHCAQVAATRSMSLPGLRRTLVSTGIAIAVAVAPVCARASGRRPLSATNARRPTRPSQRNRAQRERLCFCFCCMLDPQQDRGEGTRGVPVLVVHVERLGGAVAAGGAAED